MTPQQQLLVERMLPYIDKMILRKIPYVPAFLLEDCRSVAVVALCEYAAKQSDENSVWVPEYAFKRMKCAVISFLLKDRKHWNNLSADYLQEKPDEYFKTGEERMDDAADIESISENSARRKNFYEVFDLLKKDYSVSEITEITHIPESRILWLLRQVKKDYLNAHAG